MLTAESYTCFKLQTPDSIISLSRLHNGVSQIKTQLQSKKQKHDFSSYLYISQPSHSVKKAFENFNAGNLTRIFKSLKGQCRKERCKKQKQDAKRSMQSHLTNICPNSLHGLKSLSRNYPLRPKNELKKKESTSCYLNNLKITKPTECKQDLK